MSLLKQMSSNNSQWTMLDNAAKIYPAIIRKFYSSFFRLEVVLYELVVAERLLEALTLTLKRYPLLQVQIRRGLFWYFFEKHEYPAKLNPMNAYEPCRYVNWKGAKQKPFWRVLVYENRIAVEISHLVTDGIGAMEFFKTLLCVYYETQHKKINNWKDIRRLDDEINTEEYEHGYRKYFSKTASKKQKMRLSFHYPEKRINRFQLIRIQVSSSKAKDIAKSYGVTITELMTAVHLYSVQSVYGHLLKNNRGIVRNLILVNLRSFFPSQTLKNFYLFVTPSINFALGRYSFEEIVKKTYCQIRNMLDPKELQQHFSEYVSGELDVLIRTVPRLLKNISLALLHRLFGEKYFLSSISNLGNIIMPEEIEKMIQSFALFSLPSIKAGKNFGIIGHKDTLTITSGRYIQNTRLEQEMAKTLQFIGLEVSFFEW